MLAGPILRAVTETSVTVWLALKASAKVTLAVTASDETSAQPLSVATLDASRIRPHLYVIPITATTTKLQFGKTDGSTCVWISLRRQVGHGEGASALRFDQMLEPVPAGRP